MGRLGVQQYNIKFNSLSYRVKGLSEPILMNYYQRGLAERVCRQAMGRLDWGPCRSTKALQSVTLLAPRQLDDLSTVHRPACPGGVPPPTTHMLLVPRDPTAMDLDVHAAAARSGKPTTPTVVSFGFYRKLCHQRNLCWRCLKLYDDVH